jgi:hypothetical protein
MNKAFPVPTGVSKPFEFSFLHLQQLGVPGIIVTMAAEKIDASPYKPSYLAS